MKGKNSAHSRYWVVLYNDCCVQCAVVHIAAASIYCHRQMRRKMGDKKGALIVRTTYVSYLLLLSALPLNQTKMENTFHLTASPALEKHLCVRGRGEDSFEKKKECYLCP